MITQQYMDYVNKLNHLDLFSEQTIENVTLDCCAAKETTGITETNCQNIPACQKLNLTGSCCATIDGTYTLLLL